MLSNASVYHIILKRRSSKRCSIFMMCTVMTGMAVEFPFGSDSSDNKDFMFQAVSAYQFILLNTMLLDYIKRFFCYESMQIFSISTRITRESSRNV